MSKAHDPHWRYVAFRLHGETPLSRRAVQNAVLGRARREGVPDEEAPQLTRYEWPHAIVRVHHFHLGAVREWLPRVTWAVEAAEKVRVETLSSSGTIKALTQRLGILRERGQPPAKEKAEAARRGGKPGPGRSAKPRSSAPPPAPPVRRAPSEGPAPPPGRVPRRRQGSSAAPPRGG